jgi:hypothetical protein
MKKIVAIAAVAAALSGAPAMAQNQGLLGGVSTEQTIGYGAVAVVMLAILLSSTTSSD